jgi:hypothetical protein
MNNIQKRVIRAHLPEYGEGSYLLVSAARRDPKETLGSFYVKPTVSLFYDAGEYGAEWELEYGPIQIWHKCGADDDGAKIHYFYDWQNAPGGSWSQLAVETHELPQAAERGDWQYIFGVLRDWAENR